MFQNHFFKILASITEVAAVILNGTKKIFAKGITTFINGPANLLNNDPKNLPYWIILDDILLLNIFLSFVVYRVANNNSGGRSYPSNILNLFSEFFLFYFRQQFLAFSTVYLLILDLLYCIQPFICIYNTLVVPLENSSIFSFYC